MPFQPSPPVPRSRAPRSGGWPAWLLASLAWADAAGAQETTAADPAAPPIRLEQSAEPGSCFVEQRVAIRVRVVVERAFLEQQMLQLFPEQLDVPVQLHVPAFGERPGLRVLAPVAAPDARWSLALDEGTVRARALPDRTSDGRRQAVFELERSVVPTVAGDLVLPAPSLLCSWATRFQSDLVSGRTALDPRRASLLGLELTLRVLPWPLADRPAAFTNAVGRFTVRAEATPRELAPGESLQLVLAVEGEGNLAEFEWPRAEFPAAFQLLGRLDDHGPRLRRLRFDLAPRSIGSLELPVPALDYLDPGPPPVYRRAATAAIPIRVHGPADDGAGPAAQGGSRAPLLLAIALGSVLLALAAARRGRRARAEAPAPDSAAARRFRERMERAGAEPATGLAEYLAYHLDCLPAATVGPALLGLLLRRGVPEELARRTARVHEQLQAARFGGHAPACDAAELRALVDALEASFRARGTPGRSA